jgi:hypothetical protein
VKRALFVPMCFAAAACSGDNSSGASAKQVTPSTPAVVVPGDAATTVVQVPPGVDPGAVHLDDLAPSTRPPTPAPPIIRERRAIDVTLRSSPPGATVAVDGTPIGVTPSFWSGYADGHEHQFVFTLPKHAIARYRFVPISSGVIHARLDPILDDHSTVAPPPELVPQPPPSAVVPPAAPPTIVPDATPTADVAGPQP